MCPSPVTIKGFFLGEGGGDFPVNQPSKSAYTPTGGLSLLSPATSSILSVYSQN